MARKKKLYWTTSKGEKLFPVQMDLSHQLNALAMMSLNVRHLRHKAPKIITAHENVSLATLRAFASVTPADVYPIYDEMLALSYKLFQDKYGLSLSSLKGIIMKAWTDGEPIDAGLEEAVRFYLRADEGERKIGGARLMIAMMVFEVIDRESRHFNIDAFRELCWMLRIDQRMFHYSAQKSDFPIMRQNVSVPSEARQTALNFGVREPDVRDDVFGLDIPFYTGR